MGTFSRSQANLKLHDSREEGLALSLASQDDDKMMKKKMIRT
jgi:hypothetical protein